MGATGAQLEPIDVAGAEAARLVVRTEKGGVLVTGFVQTDGLVQSINAAQVAPIDKLSVVLVALFGAVFLGERLTAINWAGVALIAAGAVLVALKL